MFSEGFKIFENVFSDDECEMVAAAVAASSHSSKAGVRNLMSLQQVASIASDSRLLAICREATDLDLIPYKATLFNKTGKANWLVAWHQDTALPIEREFVADGWGPFTEKAGILYGHAPTKALKKIVALRIHLDASTSSNGPLRIIPGSYRFRIGSDAEFRKVVNEGPHLELTVGRGGVIAMSPLLIHASSKCLNDEPRRVLHIEYSESMNAAPGIRLAIA